MEKLLIGLGATILAGVILVIAAVLGSIMGAFSGWIVGLLFPETFKLLNEILNVSAAPWQIGTILGFVGGFFKATLTKND